jgi:hypothetical protein
MMTRTTVRIVRIVTEGEEEEEAEVALDRGATRVLWALLLQV